MRLIQPLEHSRKSPYSEIVVIVTVGIVLVVVGILIPTFAEIHKNAV